MNADLLEARNRFLKEVEANRNVAQDEKARITRVIDSLLEWSQQPAYRHRLRPSLPPSVTPHNVSQNTVGFRLSPEDVVVWNAFPRARDGAKIDIAAGESRGSRVLDSGALQRLLRFLESLPGYERGKVPRIPVASLSPPHVLEEFERLLDALVEKPAPSATGGIRRRPTQPGTGETATPQQQASPEASRTRDWEPGPDGGDRLFPWARDEEYSPEFMGKTSGRGTGEEREREVRHGAVVDALRLRLKELGWIPNRNRQRDLRATLARSPQNGVLFEVKTDVSTDSIYKATGQLMINAIPSRTAKPLNRIMVLPGAPSDAYLEGLEILGIAVLYYRWQEGAEIGPAAVEFRQLEDVLTTSESPEE